MLIIVETNTEKITSEVAKGIQLSLVLGRFIVKEAIILNIHPFTCYSYSLTQLIYLFRTFKNLYCHKFHC